jgi:hypothetical protein
MLLPLDYAAAGVQTVEGVVLCDDVQVAVGEERLRIDVAIQLR